MHIKSEKGSMAVYVSIVLLTMLLVLMAIFLTSNSTRKMQLISAMEVKSSYEADNDRAADIYSDVSGNAGPQYISNGMVLHYDAINNTGNGHSASTKTWKDLSGNGNDGTFNVTPNSSIFFWEEDSITISGNNNNGQYYMDTPLRLTGSERTYIYTIDGTNMGGYSVIWSEGDSSNRYGLLNRYNFISNRSSDTGNDNRYEFNFNRSGIYSYAVTLTNSEMKLYENGVLIATLDNTKGLTTNNNLRILGSRYSSESNQVPTNIKMYNFIAYDRALSAEEIQQNFEIDKERFNVNDLKVVYTQDFTSTPSYSTTATSYTVSNSIIRLTSSSADPMVYMSNVTSFNPNTNRYIDIR